MEKTSRKSLSSLISDGDEKPAGTIGEKLKGASPYLGLTAVFGGLSAYEFSRVGAKAVILPYTKALTFSAITGPVGLAAMGVALTGIFLGLGVYSMYAAGKKYKESKASYNPE